jgi:hypothetical protein
MGQIVIYDDGWVTMQRQPAHVESADVPWARKGSALAWASCVIMPFDCVRIGGLLFSKQKFQGVKTRSLGEAEPDIKNYGDRFADKTTGDTVDAPPVALEALWDDGQPLTDGAPVLESYDARKAAILDFWNSRTDTVWGDRVRLAVEAFIRAEVQGSAHPFTPDEVAAFNRRRNCVRELDLTSDFEALTMDVESEQPP